MEDRGCLPASTLHRLCLEDSFVKCIQARFSDFRIILLPAPSHPELVEGQWLFAGFVPEYSGGSVPDFDGVPFSRIPPIQLAFDLTDRIRSCQVLLLQKEKLEFG